MSLAMEETTFHVGKPLPSAQSMPEEKGRVKAAGAPSPAGRGHVPEPGRRGARINTQRDVKS